MRYPIGQVYNNIQERERHYCYMHWGEGVDGEVAVFGDNNNNSRRQRPWSETETLSGHGEHVRKARNVQSWYFWRWELVTEELE